MSNTNDGKGEAIPVIPRVPLSSVSSLVQWLRRIIDNQPSRGQPGDIEANTTTGRKNTKKCALKTACAAQAFPPTNLVLTIPSGNQQTPPAPEIETFLTTTSGTSNIQKTALSSYQSTYIAFVKNEIENVPNETFTELFQRDNNTPVSTNEVFTFLNEVATCMKNKRHVSIDSIARDC